MRKGLCIHFRSAGMPKTCAAGVNYDDVTPEPHQMQGKGLRRPCDQIPFPNASIQQLEQFSRRGTCPKFQEPTSEKIAEYDATIAAMFKRMELLDPVLAPIRTAQAGKDWRGVIECPACKGRLHLTHAKYNGHMHGRCETENCISWME